MDLSRDYLSILYIVNNIVSFVRYYILHANNMRQDINTFAFNQKSRHFNIKEIAGLETNCILIGLKKIHQYPQINSRITHKIRYSRACGSYQYFLDRGLLLIRKLLNQGFLLVEVITSKVLRSPPWFGWSPWNICHKWPRICSTCRKHFPVISTYHWIYK